MLVMAEMIAAVADLSDDEKCPFCRDQGFITCPDHLAEGNYETDGDGLDWCFTCDTAFEDPPLTSCACERMD